MSVTTALENPRKITVKELFEMELEEGYFYELINGIIVKKQAPSPQHQKAVSQLVTIFNNFVLEKQLGDVYPSPIDVFFDKHNITQPDVLFIRKDRQFIITKDGIQGHPNLVVEVLSPSSVSRDMTEKLAEYTSLTALDAYIVASQEEPIVWLWQRLGEDRLFPAQPVEIRGRDKAIDLEALKISLPLAELYRPVAKS